MTCQLRWQAGLPAPPTKAPYPSLVAGPWSGTTAGEGAAPLHTFYSSHFNRDTVWCWNWNSREVTFQVRHSNKKSKNRSSPSLLSRTNVNTECGGRYSHIVNFCRSHCKCEQGPKRAQLSCSTMAASTCNAVSNPSDFYVWRDCWSSENRLKMHLCQLFGAIHWLLKLPAPQIDWWEISSPETFSRVSYSPAVFKVPTRLRILTPLARKEGRKENYFSSSLTPGHLVGTEESSQCVWCAQIMN